MYIVVTFSQGTKNKMAYFVYLSLSQYLDEIHAFLIKEMFTLPTYESNLFTMLTLSAILFYRKYIYLTFPSPYPYHSVQHPL